MCTLAEDNSVIPGVTSLLSPALIKRGQGGSLSPAFASAFPIGWNTVKLAFAFILYGGFLTLLS
ncbi:hypothetical protein AOG55_02205 [Acidiplasma cupricumulans]|jgi:hypothetical protein|uniref:Uncharacterized protein n=1 Tax=Acidiplasma cupricumulans TaxID=312540 RepID=A0A0Q0WEC5_9ARCH|nr:hypothetical protein AOG55_02205 [Acidiplasma cupricumulans]